jgi:hypothetical protein
MGLIRTVVTDPVGEGISQIVSCTEERNPARCARSGIQDLLSIMRGDAVMNVLAPVLTPQQCHYIGHVVGQEVLYRTENMDTEAAISSCNRVCDSACVHGIIGETFAQAMGLGKADQPDELDVRHLTIEEIRVAGKTLCESPEPCHGVGHALFQVYGSFDPVLEICREVSAGVPSPSYCYQGAFMEYADVLFGRHTRDITGVSEPDPDSLREMCLRSDTLEKRSCFRYFPRMYLSTLRDQRLGRSEEQEALREMCLTYEGDDQLACIAGIGVYQSYALAADPVDATRLCRRFDSFADQAACNLGQVSVASQDRQEKVLLYCRALTSDALKSSCYQTIYFFLARLGTPVTDITAQCKDDICRTEAVRATMDPFVYINRLFPEVRN